MSIASTADVLIDERAEEPVTLLLGSAETEVGVLADALGAGLTLVPTFTDGASDWPWADELDAWRASLVDGDPVDRAIVAPWAPCAPVRPLVELPLDAWIRGAEAPLAVWVTALGVAAARVRDGGVVVAVAERPAPLDSAGRGIGAAVADGVEALVRSLARSEGPRGVRVNLVTTPTRVAPDRPVAPAPSLSTFPGTTGTEVVGAVRLLSGDGTEGVTGTVVHADCGRSWR